MNYRGDSLTRLITTPSSQESESVEVDLTKVAPSILALYCHEGWQKLHDEAALRLTRLTLSGPRLMYERMNMDEYVMQQTKEFLTLLEEEIPYGAMLKDKEDGT